MKIAVTQAAIPVAYLDADPRTPVRDLKRQIFEQLKIPVDLQRLDYYAKVLEDNQTLEQAGIKGDASLKLTVLTPEAKGVDADQSLKDFFTAAQEGDIQYFQNHEIPQTFVRAKNERGQHALYLTARFSGSIEVLNWLLDHGAEINEVESHGSTALHGAAWAGKEAVVELLLRRGANPEIRNAYGNTPKMEKPQIVADALQKIKDNPHGAPAEQPKPPISALAPAPLLAPSPISLQPANPIFSHGPVSFIHFSNPGSSLVPAPAPTPPISSQNAFQIFPSASSSTSSSIPAPVTTSATHSIAAPASYPVSFPVSTPTATPITTTPEPLSSSSHSVTITPFNPVTIPTPVAPVVKTPTLNGQSPMGSSSYFPTMGNPKLSSEHPSQNYSSPFFQTVQITSECLKRVKKLYDDGYLTREAHSIVQRDILRNNPNIFAMHQAFTTDSDFLEALHNYLGI